MPNVFSGQQKRARNAGQIRAGGDADEAGLAREGRDLWRLAGAEFQAGQAAWGEQFGERGDDGGVGGQAIRAAVESSGGLVAGDFGHEGGDGGAFDVGRVGEDQVEVAREGSGPVGGKEESAGGEAESRGIACGEAGGLGGEIGADAQRIGELGEGGEEEAAGAGAEVQDAKRTRVPGRRKWDEGGLDQGFGVGAGDEGGGGDLARSKVQKPRVPVM